MEHPSKILKTLGIAPLKALGQNFLVQNNSLENIADHIDLASCKNILEIGPGLGSVTELFIKKGHRITLCEKDKALASYLKQMFTSSTSIEEVLHSDFLEVPSKTWEDKGITAVISNLPFNITSPALISIIGQMPFIKKAIFGVQLEVAQKLTNEKDNFISIFFEGLGDLKFQKKISRNSFYPVPDVDVAWISFERNQRIQNTDDFFIFLKGAFWGKRKTLYNSIHTNPFFREIEKTKKWIEVLDESTNPSIKKYLLQRADELHFIDYKMIFETITNYIL